MKKKLFITVALAVLTTVGILSCKKQNNAVSSQTSKHDAAVAQIIQIRANVEAYKKTHVGAKTTGLPGWTKTVAADFSGGATGVRYGGRIGTALGDPVMGVAAGAVLGAVIGSGWQLWSTYNNSPLAPPPGPPTPSWANSYDNGYQQVGYLHDISCVSLFSGGTRYATNPADFSAQVYPIVVGYIANAYGINSQVITQSVSLNDIQSYETSYNPDASIADNMAVLAPYINDEKIENYVQSIMTDFLSCDPADTSDMYAFFNAYYSSVSSDATLSTTEIGYLLSAISVGQYSLALWTSNLADFQ